jgi:hypothetical protein
MQTLRVSATDIDALRYFLHDEEAEIADLLAQLRRESPPTPAMMAGTAFHAALETAAIGDHVGFQHDGYTFSFETDAELDLPPIREMKGTREYQVGDVLVTLVGKVDAIHGRKVHDHKLTAQYEAEKYLGAYQWRIYLEVFDADEFRWNIFEGRESPEGSKNYLIRAVHPLTMHRYPGIGDDVAREVAEFVAFARVHLPERFAPADALAIKAMIETKLGEKAAA